MEAYLDRITITPDSSDPSDTEPDYTGATTVENLPCTIHATRGLEEFRGRQLEGKVDFIVECWFRSDVNTSDQITVDGSVAGAYDGRTLEIVNFIPMRTAEHPPKLQIDCTEKN